MKSNNSLYIRRAYKDEIITILSEWQIATKLSKPVLECMDGDHTLICYSGYRLLASVVQVGDKSDRVYEVHVACPRDSIKASRVLALIGMQWVVTDRNIKAKKLITKAPAGKITNFALKLGFKLQADGKLVYVF